MKNKSSFKLEQDEFIIPYHWKMSLEELKKMALEVSRKAYAPYSNFMVGCAILTESGNTYVGCNVENASYGLTTCAERNAIANAVSTEGEVKIKTVVVYTPTPTATPPCGACRQVIHEFGNPEIISFCSGDEERSASTTHLLPWAFDLEKG